ALGSGARFVARAVDTQQTHLPGVLERACAHVGTSFVEILQNCVVYNDGVYSPYTDRDVAPDMQLHVEHGKPLVFGRARDKGLRLDPATLSLETVPVGEGGVDEADLLVHDETNAAQAGLLAMLETPVALGVLYCVPAPSYEHLVTDQVETIEGGKGAAGLAELNALLRARNTWAVEP
ncbi:MAG: 2-oxoacid:ferredoxin oxidoreductase subunit beta, partial [Kiloniellaceae bacterium]